MADSYVETVAGQLADLTLADQEASGDIAIVDTVAKVLGASSQTLEEAFLTAVRVRRAEARARALLADRKANGYAIAAPTSTAPMQGETEADDPVVEEPAETEQAREEKAKQDALDILKSRGLGGPRRVTR